MDSINQSILSKMKKTHTIDRHSILMAGLCIMSSALMSIPFLVPNTGFLTLIGLVPLLCAENIATETEKKRFWIYHYGTFLLWNLITTFWVCNATIGGGLFASFANAFQMSLVFGLFRWAKKRTKSSLAYIFLIATWIAWERFYFDAEISWPWLVLGNAFSRSIWAIQWYEYTGVSGGTLWILLSNISIFALMKGLSNGEWHLLNKKAKIAAITGLAVILITPFILSSAISKKYENAHKEGEKLQVLITQPNIDPYHKFEYLTQNQQNDILIKQMETALGDSISEPTLIVAPETFTNDICVNTIQRSPTWQRFVNFLKKYPNANLLFGASTYELINSQESPSHTARALRSGIWYESHNSAFMIDHSERTEIFHKSKLVVAVEKTPYPALFCKIDDMLGGVMGRCIGQDEISLLNFQSRVGDRDINIPIGCAICYESVYGEYYCDYIRKGARAMTVITNDAWWGDTPGYKQHLSYSCLRAIETRRAIARSANTGISAIISPSGEIIESTEWWVADTIKGEIPLRDDLTFFVRHGDIIGRVSTFLFGLILLLLIVLSRVAKPSNSRREGNQS